MDKISLPMAGQTVTIPTAQFLVVLQRFGTTASTKTVTVFQIMTKTKMVKNLINTVGMIVTIPMHPPLMEGWKFGTMV